MNRRAVNYALAAWAAAATLAFGLLWRSHGRPLEWFAAEPTELDAATEPSKAADASTDADPATAVVAMARYDLCRAQGLPQLSRTRLPGRPLIGVHCGPTARLLRFVAGEPQVLFDFTLSLSPPHAHALPAPLLVFDVNQDGQKDLLVGQRYEDEQSTPLNGSLAILRAAERGGFDPPQELLAAHPLALIPIQFNGADHTVLTILHGRNGHHDLGPELWAFSPDEVPPRTRLSTLPTGSQALLALDIDLDGTDELLLAGERGGEAGLWIWFLAPPHGDENQRPAPRFLPMGPINGAAKGDINGDGAPDALLAGRKLWVLHASRDQPQRPEAVADSACTGGDGPPSACHRDPEILAAATDAGVQLKTYVHPEIRRYSPTVHQSTEVLTLEGAGMSVLDTISADIDDDGTLDLLLLIHPVERPQAAQLAILPDYQQSHRARFGAHRGAMPEDLLHTSDDL